MWHVSFNLDITEFGFDEIMKEIKILFPEAEDIEIEEINA